MKSKVGIRCILHKVLPIVISNDQIFEQDLILELPNRKILTVFDPVCIPEIKNYVKKGIAVELHINNPLIEKIERIRKNILVIERRKSIHSKDTEIIIEGKVKELFKINRKITTLIVEIPEIGTVYVHLDKPDFIYPKFKVSEFVRIKDFSLTFIHAFELSGKEIDRNFGKV